MTWALATIAATADRLRDGLAAAGTTERLGRDVLHQRRPARRSGVRAAAPSPARRRGQAARRDHADAGAVRGRVADLVAGAPPRVFGAAAAAGDRPAAHDPRRSPGRRGGDTGNQLHGGAGARDRARVHRRGARPGGRHRHPHPVPDPPGAERRERAQRRTLRAPVLHRDRDRRGGGGHGFGALRNPARAGADRLRADRRRRGRSSGRYRGEARRAPPVDRATLAADPEHRVGAAGGRRRERAGRKHLHRRVHGRFPVRRAARRDRRRGVLPRSTRVASCSTR